MKNKLLLLFFLISAATLRAQDYKMIRMEEMVNSMSARENIKEDDNDQKCAVIRISTQDITPEQRQGFHFGSDWGAEIVENTIIDGEIWVWVSPGLKTLKINHATLGNIEVAVTKHVTIQSLHTYRIVLKGTMKQGQDGPKVTQQFLVLEVTPKDAMVLVDNQTWFVENGVASKMVTFGKHNITVEASDYHSYNEEINVSYSENAVTKKINLKPEFGYLKIVGDNSILSQSTIYVNSANGADAMKSPMKLKSGKYKVSILNRKYKPFEKEINIVDGETYTLNVNFNSDFSSITLQVNAEAEIYVNGEKKGVRQWTGELPAGTYHIECRMKNHKSSMVEKVITENMSGETIQLEVPKPINGTLVVNTTPIMAKLFVDDNYEGETPKQINSIMIGEHTIRIEKSGYAMLIEKVTIEDGKTLTLDKRLEQGKNIQVKSDQEGDLVYIDDSYFGKTPLYTSLKYGKYHVKVVRGTTSSEKTIEVKAESNEHDFFFEFGRLINISTDTRGDQIFIDGKKVGTSPISLDLPYGSYTILAKRGKKTAEQDIHILRSGGTTEYYLIPKPETASHFVEKGVHFITLNCSYSLDGTFEPDKLLSYGLCLGSVKKFGWFIGASSNFNSNALKYDVENDSDGLVDGYFPTYTSEGAFSRLSIVGGMMLQLSGPHYLRAGAGYGQRYKSLYITDGRLVNISNESFNGVDVLLGYQLNLKGFTMSVDLITTNFGAFEAKLGLGYCMKRRK